MISQKLCSPLGLFGLKSVRRFVTLAGRIKRTVCLVFYLVIKIWQNFYKKPYQTWKTVVKIFKKHQNVPTGTQKKKRQILFNSILGEYTLFLHPILICLKGENENWVQRGRRVDQFLKRLSGRKRKRERNTCINIFSYLCTNDICIYYTYIYIYIIYIYIYIYINIYIRIYIIYI